MLIEIDCPVDPLGVKNGDLIKLFDHVNDKLWIKVVLGMRLRANDEAHLQVFGSAGMAGVYVQASTLKSSWPAFTAQGDLPPEYLEYTFPSFSGLNIDLDDLKKRIQEISSSARTGHGIRYNEAAAKILKSTLSGCLVDRVLHPIIDLVKGGSGLPKSASDRELSALHGEVLELFCVMRDLTVTRLFPREWLTDPFPNSKGMALQNLVADMTYQAARKRVADRLTLTTWTEKKLRRTIERANAPWA